MWISKRAIVNLSGDIRGIIDGREVDLRDNREGVWNILKSDIHTLAGLKNEQVVALGRERDVMRDNLTNISHQLKTPLTSMMIMADLLESELTSETPDTDRQTEFLANIITGLTRMDWLVAALLKMAKLDAGAAEFSPQAVTSAELVRVAAEPLRVLLDIKNQSIEVCGDTELRCDRRWTAEALTNALKNASEYSPEGGVIRIESGANPICAWIAVTDSGEGIAKADIARLFKRFEGSRSGKGHGVGLPLALAIMRAQNGDIEVSGGGNGAGATFTLKFYK
ncbi:MAG: HAMP domain-containing histidine kinase [Oscillospiraceae bacterium]|nr:HAMP domain-containing histidine kinase [Oscillospiraceae bacterium]